jgi:hypothetical protein
VDDLERRITAELAAVDPDDQPAPSLGPRILTRVRRRRRRRAVAAAAAAATAVAAIVTSTVVLLAEPAPRPVAPAVLPSPGPITPQPTRRAALDDLIDPHTVVRVPSLLPDGSWFEVMGVDAAGTVVGRRTAMFAGTPEDVWIAGPGQPTPVRMQDTRPDPYLWIMAVDGDTHIWPDGRSLKCAERTDPGRARVLDRGWGGRTSFAAGGGAIVWTTEDGRVHVAHGCRGRVRSLPTAGALDALVYPYAFVRDVDGLRQVDVRDGRAQLVPGGPPVSNSPAVPVMTLAANANLVAWGDAGTVTTLDRVTGARRRYKLEMPYAGNTMYFTGLTAGNHLLAYSMWHQDYDRASSVVIDPRTGRTAAVAARVWAAGDWLVWRDGGDYKIARARA